MGSLDPTAGILSGVGGMFTQMMSDSNADSRQSSAYASSLSNWKEMQSSAHQLEVEDLKKAGLNPILSATKGQIASSPGISTATPSNNNSISDAVSIAVQAKQAQRAYEIQSGQLDVEKGRLSVEQTKADTDKINARANLMTAISNSAKNYSDIDVNTVRAQQIVSDIENAKSLLQGQLSLMEKQGRAAEGQAAAGFANASQAYAIANKAIAEAKLIGKDLDLYDSPEYKKYMSDLLGAKSEIAEGNLKDSRSSIYKAFHSFGNYLDALLPGDRSNIRVGKFGSIGSISEKSGGSK